MVGALLCGRTEQEGMQMRSAKGANAGGKAEHGQLAELFSSQVRADVLIHMLAHRSTALSLTEISRQLGLAVSSVQHEIYKLERLGILLGRREGNSRRYRLTTEQPMTRALERLVQTSIGLEASLLAVFTDVQDLEWATVASSSGTDVSDAMLVLVGSLDLGCLASIQERIAEILGIPGNRLVTSFFTLDVWKQHLLGEYPLVNQLHTLSTLAVYGDIA